MYAERPLTQLPGVAWEVTASAPYRVLPDGCTDLIWMGGRLMVAGPDTRATVIEPSETRIVGVRFPPGIGPSVFGIAAHELRDVRLPLLELWPGPEVPELEERLAAGADAAALLEAVAAAHADGGGGAEPSTEWVAHELDRGTAVAEIARRLGITERHLYRRSVIAFGYGAKTLQRILRLQRALTLVRRGSPAAIAALDAGYADQAHLAHDVRALTGVSLGGLLRS
jgi:AraC-like DNA-binding protein